MYERIKLLRKDTGLSQKEFGDKLGVSRDVISNIELGRVEPKESLIKLICKEFNIDYIWLTTGLGEMKADLDLDIMEKIDNIMVGENEFHKNLFKFAVNLDEDDLIALEKLTLKFLELKKAEN